MRKFLIRTFDNQVLKKARMIRQNIENFVKRLNYLSQFFKTINIFAFINA